MAIIVSTSQPQAGWSRSKRCIQTDLPRAGSGWKKKRTASNVRFISEQSSIFSVKHCLVSVEHTNNITSSFSIQNTLFSMKHALLSIKHTLLFIEHRGLFRTTVPVPPSERCSFSVQCSSFSVEHYTYILREKKFNIRRKLSSFICTLRAWLLYFPPCGCGLNEGSHVLCIQTNQIEEFQPTHSERAVVEGVRLLPAPNLRFSVELDRLKMASRGRFFVVVFVCARRTGVS